MNYTLSIEFSGTLIAPAQARTRIVDKEGHARPALCMDIELDDTNRKRIHVESIFDQGKHNECEAAAHRYKKGTRVTFQTKDEDLQLSALNVSHIHIHPDAAPAAQQLDQVATPSLF